MAKNYSTQIFKVIVVKKRHELESKKKKIKKRFN